jgi:plastocyanin domain-containing protein
MTLVQLIVNLAGAATIVGIVWYFWLYRKGGRSADLVNGLQQVEIKVKGAYDPDVVVVRRGQPVRLLFRREESSLCSEMVIFDKIGRSAKLPEGETVAIDFTPEQVGEIPFQCQMGMLRGKVVVEA